METARRRPDASETLFAGDTVSRAAPGYYRIIVRDLVLPWRIGVRRHEEDRRQRVRVNLDLMVGENDDPQADDYQKVLCYEKIVENIRRMAASGHVRLAETVAHAIAAMCLDDPRAQAVTVRVEKLEAIHDAGSVGVEINRIKGDAERLSTNGGNRILEKRPSVSAEDSTNIIAKS